MQILNGSPKASLSTIKIKTPDITDGQVWVQSSIFQTIKLNRGTKEEFTFSRSDLVVITNRGEDFCTLDIELIARGETGIFIGSNRRGGRSMAEGESMQTKMRPGEVLTVRSIDMVEPRGTNADGSPVQVCAGQNVVA
jgi:hypothetical protein